MLANALSYTDNSPGLTLVLISAVEAEHGRFGIACIVRLDVMVIVESNVEGRVHCKETIIAVEDHQLAVDELGREIEGQLKIGAAIGIYVVTNC